MKYVPMILGTVSEEGRMFVWQLFPPKLVDFECDAMVDVMFPIVADKV